GSIIELLKVIGPLTNPTAATAPGAIIDRLRKLAEQKGVSVAQIATTTGCGWSARPASCSRPGRRRGGLAGVDGVVDADAVPGGEL
ncbi:hypothetical protein ABK046_48580, partial [Streptomyces caeruleatus]